MDIVKPSTTVLSCLQLLSSGKNYLGSAIKAASHFRCHCISVLRCIGNRTSIQSDIGEHRVTLVVHKGIIRHPGTAQRYWTFSLSSRSRKLACLLCSSFIFKYSIPEASQTHGFIQSDLGIETAFLADRPDSLPPPNEPIQKRQSFFEFQRAPWNEKN